MSIKEEKNSHYFRKKPKTAFLEVAMDCCSASLMAPVMALAPLRPVAALLLLPVVALPLRPLLLQWPWRRRCCR